MSLAPLIEQALGAVRPAALAKGIEIVSAVPPLPPVEGDARRLQQVLANLLSNAVKFTPEKGRVELRCSADAATVSLEVSDSGIGITAEFLPFVFERFRQADSTTTRHEGGLGLGLAIARYLAEQHGGGLTAESPGRNLGSTFRLTLPVLPALRATPPSFLLEPAKEVTLAGARILVVDDDADARGLIRMMLEAHAAEVADAASAELALASAQASPFDLLVADIAMPRTDGYTLLEQIRRIQPALAAIAVTAYARPEDRARAKACGYDAFAAKPIEMPNLLAMVVTLLAPRPAAPPAA